MGKSMQSKVLSGCMPDPPQGEQTTNEPPPETPHFWLLPGKTTTFRRFRSLRHLKSGLNLAPKVREG